MTDTAKPSIRSNARSRASRRSRKTDYSKIDIDELLKQRRQIAAIWGTDDIREVPPDLTDDQAWKVLKECNRRHDCNDGLTWDFIEVIADAVFPSSNDGETNEKGA